MFNPIRTLARPMLASMFVAGGIDALQTAEEKAPVADDVVEPVSEHVDWVDQLDTPQAVRINGAVQVVGGLALALGKAPRLASAALAGTLVPTTLAAHRFWEMDDEAEKQQHQIHFFKNLSMLGGLLIAALDTEGEPGVAWRAKHKAEHVGRRAERTKREAELKAEAAKERAKRATADARHAGGRAKQRLELGAKHQADLLGTRAELAKEKLTPDIGDARRLAKAFRD